MKQFACNMGACEGKFIDNCCDGCLDRDEELCTADVMCSWFLESGSDACPCRLTKAVIL